MVTFLELALLIGSTCAAIIIIGLAIALLGLPLWAAVPLVLGVVVIELLLQLRATGRSADTGEADE